MNSGCPLCETKLCEAYPKLWDNLRRPDGYRWLSIHDDMNGITRTEMPAIWETPHVYPPVATQIANAAKAVVDFVSSGFATVDQAEFDRRREICQGCEFLNHKDDACSRCGCSLKIKPWGKAFHCPINLW